MATTATVVTLCCLSAVCGTVSAALPAQAAGDLPWKDIAGGGAAVLMLVALVVVLRFIATDRAANAAEREKAAEERKTEAAAQRAHVEKVAEKFADTTTQLFAAVREDAATARRDLQDIVRERNPR